MDATASPPSLGNPSDQHRDAVLRHLYALHRHARGMRVGAGFREIAGALKMEGLKERDVASAIDYLGQVGWVVKVVEPRQFVTPAGTVQSSEKVWFKISSTGMDRLERPSVYRRPPSGSVSIVNVQGVTVLGDGNIVNTRGVGVLGTLSELEEAVQGSSLSDSAKLSAVADIGTIKAQLAKPAPNREIVRSAWSTIEALVTVGSLAQLVLAAGTALQPFLH